MLLELVYVGKTESAGSIAALELLLLALLDMCSLPLPAVPSMSLSFQPKLPFSFSVSASPYVASFLLGHLLLHVTHVFLLFLLQVVLTESPKSPFF